ncbi:exo-alpha-sialidase [Paenibacillus doosanensis]|uniref:BNR/Asp-box repeat protein n=1 Tax=Paenibacillus konkukensis TaxID=2020716 RepID=A0ABY4RI78_9BACL|nr:MULTISPECIES: sialidase family protein [Paenibacillus]MCS7459757.1 exo-alpha-sialidase [Paenibacillus doosanensis]UQZ81825.1 BNR/Asp-box repeat protein [Paenibacillus konkukensis]
MSRFNGVVTVPENDSSIREAFLPVIHPNDSHAANLLELDNGDLLCVWFNGSGEGNPDTNIVMSRLPAGSHVWEAPVQLSGDPERSEQNPVLFQAPDGKLWLMHTSNEPHNQKTSRVVRRISEDRGFTWGPPEVLFDGMGIFLRQPIVVLSNGDWILPAYYCKMDGHYSVVQISTDQGRTWQEHPVQGSVHRVQMNIVELGSGVLYAVFRSRQADRIYTSHSYDKGRTWTVPVKSKLANNNSSIQLTRLHNGHLALIFNDSTMERDQFRWVSSKGNFRRKPLRTPLTLAISEDEGQTWPYFRNVQMADLEYKDSEIGYSYPSIITTKDGAIHVAFSYLRKGIKYVRVEEEWARQE